jgi:O-antigen ligase
MTKILDKYDRQKKNLNLFVLGVFFLLWSVNGYFIGGNKLKFILLFIGFICILFVTITQKIDKNHFRFFLFSLIFLLLYWCVAFLRFQETTDPTSLFFDIICLILLNSGFIISKKYHLFKEINPNVIFIICILTILGAIMFLKNQSNINFESNVRIGSEVKDDNINSVGLAYINANIFFIIFNFFGFVKKRKWLNIFIILALFSIVIIIISSGARGASLSLAFTFFLPHIFKFNKDFFSKFFKILFYVFILILSYFMLVKYFPVIEQKIDSSFERFSSLFDFYATKSDRSVLEREELYNNFFNNYDKYIFIGKKKYFPYPHNIFIEIIMRWGVFLSIPLLFLIIKNIFKSISIIKSTSNFPFFSFFVFCFLFSFLQSLTSMSLEMNRMLWLSLGFVAGLKDKYLVK